MAKQYSLKMYIYAHAAIGQKPRFEAVLDNPYEGDQLPVRTARLVVEKIQKEQGFLCDHYTIEPMPVGSGGLLVLCHPWGENLKV